MVVGFFRILQKRVQRLFEFRRPLSPDKKLAKIGDGFQNLPNVGGIFTDAVTPRFACNGRWSLGRVHPWRILEEEKSIKVSCEFYGAQNIFYKLKKKIK